MRKGSNDRSRPGVPLFTLRVPTSRPLPLHYQGLFGFYLAGRGGASTRIVRNARGCRAGRERGTGRWAGGRQSTGARSGRAGCCAAALAGGAWNRLGPTACPPPVPRRLHQRHPPAPIPGGRTTSMSTTITSCPGHGPVGTTQGDAQILDACRGGCELAQSTDFIIASDDATFGQPEVMPASRHGQKITVLSAMTDRPDPYVDECLGLAPEGFPRSPIRWQRPGRVACGPAGSSGQGLPSTTC